MTAPSKRLLLFTAKLGYQTRSFEDAARKLGVQLVYITDRCHQLEDPWGDQAIAVHFETPGVAAYTVMEALRGQDVNGILALGDRTAAAAAYAARWSGSPLQPSCSCRGLPEQAAHERSLSRCRTLCPVVSESSHRTRARAGAAGYLLSLCSETAFAFGESGSRAREQS